MSLYRDARDYAYKMVPKNPNFDIPLGYVLIGWLVLAAAAAVMVGLA